MLNTIRQFFDTRLTRAGNEPASEEHRLQLATAALLIEMMRVDDDIKDEERQAVLAALQAKFDLNATETTELMRLAEEEARAATDYFQFTSLINRGFSAEQKERVIEHMWEIAYADSTLDRHEQHLMRKIAELLHIPHKRYIGAKLRARERRLGG